MNPLYTIMESRHRWLILSGISVGAAVLGAIMMIAYGWDHTLARIWFYLGLILAVAFLARLVFETKASLDESVANAERRDAGKPAIRQVGEDGSQVPPSAPA